MFSLVAAAWLAAQSPAPAVYEAETRSFRDWTVVCDNHRRCTALGLATSAMRAQGRYALLSVVHQGGPRPISTLALLDQPKDAPPGPVLVGKDLKLTPNWDAVRQSWFVDGAKPLADLADSPDGVLTVKAAGMAPMDLSLDGASEAFAWIRFKQAQPFKPGKIAASEIKPPAPQRPLGPPPAGLVKLSAKLTQLGICGGMGGSAKGALHPMGWLDGGHRLWSVYCDGPGGRGRNAISVLVLVDSADGLAFARLEDAPDGDWSTPGQVLAAKTGDATSVPMASEASFAPRSGIVETTDASPGLDHYAERTSRYGWTGKAFVLVDRTDAAVMAADGDGNAAPYFSFWPPEYRM